MINMETPSIQTEDPDAVVTGQSHGTSVDIDETEPGEAKLLIPPTTRVQAWSDGETACRRKRGHETVVVEHQLYTQAQLDEVYEDMHEPETPWTMLQDACTCSGQCACDYFWSLLPVVKVMRFYRWREWTPVDLLSGLSVAFIHLPQGLAYGILASLQPINGLYTSFFPIVTYLIFGTCPHISMGTNAVIALPIAEIVERRATAHFATTHPNSTLLQEGAMEYKVGISAAVCLVSGVVLLAMGLLRLGFVTDYLAKSFIGGFTFAAAVHIVTSQVPKLLGLNDIPRREGVGKVIMTYVDLILHARDTNVADVVIGVLSMAVLLAVKIGINERYKMKLKVPVPIELIVVILSTVISHFAELNDRFGVAIVGDVPRGLPKPTLPPLEEVPSVIYDALPIATIIFALNIALGKICARMHGYDVDDNQELVAYGLCQLVGCLFQNFPSSTAPPRTMMLSSMGAKSTMNGVTSAVVILLVLVVAGQLFVSLPIAMLAAMIIVAMKDLLLQVLQLRSLWHVNKADFSIWLFTASVCIVAGLAPGLALGVGFSMLTVLTVSKLAAGKLIGMSVTEDVVASCTRLGIEPLPGIRIFKFNAPLFFASAERFKTQLYSKVFTPGKEQPKPALVDLEIDVPEPSGDGTNNVEFDVHASQEVPSACQAVGGADTVHHVIIDCSPMTYIDVSGIDMLELIIMQFSRSGVEVFLADVSRSTFATLRRAKFFDKWNKGNVFYSVHDAVKAAAMTDMTRSVFAEVIVKLN